MLPQYAVRFSAQGVLISLIDEFFDDVILFSPYRCNICFFIATFIKDNCKLQTIKNYETPKLLRCSGCKLVSYCSNEHQKLHWKFHKEMCVGVRAIFKQYNIKYMNELLHKPPFIYFRKKHYLILVKELFQKLKREITINESFCLCFERKCSFCGNFDMDSNKNIVLCEICKIVCYCNENCKTNDAINHQNDCSNLKLMFNYYYYKDGLILNYGDASTNINLLKVENLIEFLKYFGFDKKLSKDLKPRNQEQFNWLCSASSYSSITTVLFCLQHCKILNQNNHLILHIYGYDLLEVIRNFSINKIKLLLSQTTNVKKLTLLIVSLSKSDYSFNSKKISIKFNKRKISIEFYYLTGKHSDYLHIVNISELSKKPHLIFVENFDQYINMELLNIYDFKNYSNTIFAFTSFCFQFSNDNLKEILNNKSNIITIVENAKNPFKSPIAQYFCQCCVYLNSYLNIFKYKI